jgi:hypothetical protein
MAAADEFRQALERGDVKHLRRIWSRVAPHLPQPASDEEAEIAMHQARTAARSVQFKHRAWSHRWLAERCHRSCLPDDLKPKAERLYPVVVSGVGIAVKSNFPEVVAEVRGAMSDAVEEAFADGRTEPEFVRARMQEARTRAKLALFGRTSTLVGAR